MTKVEMTSVRECRQGNDRPVSVGLYNEEEERQREKERLPVGKILVITASC